MLLETHRFAKGDKKGDLAIDGYGMDTTSPPGLQRSPTRSTSNRKTQNDSGMRANLLDGEQIQKEVLEVSRKEDLEMDDLSKHKANDLGGSGDGGSSWVKIAQERKVLKKYDLKIVESEDGKAVEIPDEVIEKVDLLWEDYLIGKFLDTAPHVARVHSIVNRIWNQGEPKKQIDVHIVDETTMKFKVQNPAMRARILKGGMWNIGNVPLVVTKWTPDELKEKPEIKSIPMWVYLKNVPMNMFSWQGLSFIVSAAGFPVRLHPETASCSNFKLEKIFVNVDLSKELPDKINFTKHGKSSLVEFIYPWLPQRCKICGKWGHMEKGCAMNKKDLEEVVSQNKNDGSLKKIIDQSINDGSSKNNNDEEGIGETPKENHSERSENKEDEENVEVPRENLSGKKRTETEEGEMVEEWQDVTPEKASRNAILKFGQVQILTPSRFSPLEVNEKGEMVTDVEFEEILNVTEEIIEEEVGKTKEKDKEDKEELEINDGNMEMNGTKEQTEVNIAAENQNQGVAGIQNTQENWPDLASASKIRPSLQRKAKMMHRVISKPDGNKGNRNKKSFQ